MIVAMVPTFSILKWKNLCSNLKYLSLCLKIGTLDFDEFWLNSFIFHTNCVNNQQWTRLKKREGETSLTGNKGSASDKTKP